MCNCLQNCFENSFKFEVEKFTHTYILYRQIHKVMPQDHLSALKIQHKFPCLVNKNVFNRFVAQGTMGTNKRVLKGLTVSCREKVIFYCQLSKMQYLGRKSSRAVLIKIHTTWLSFASLISLVLSSPVLPLVVSMNVVLGLPRFGWRAQWPANLNLLAWIVSLTNVVASVH